LMIWKAGHRHQWLPLISRRQRQSECLRAIYRVVKKRFVKVANMKQADSAVRSLLAILNCFRAHPFPFPNSAAYVVTGKHLPDIDPHFRCRHPSESYTVPQYGHGSGSYQIASGSGSQSGCQHALHPHQPMQMLSQSSVQVHSGSMSRKGKVDCI
jgi:hypothetical protein